MLLRHDLGDLVRQVIERSRATPHDRALLFLDELVSARDWDVSLKTFCGEQWPVEILATSSATAAQRDRRRESGVGRWTEYYLAPYSFPEYLDLVGRRPVLPL